MRVSAGSIIASAVMVAFAPALWLEQMEVLQLSGVTLPELRKISPALAIFMLSAAAGKLAAIASGPPAVALFCRLNSFATCLVALCASVGDGAGVATWGTFAAGYALVGYHRFDATVPPPIVAVARNATPARVLGGVAAAAFGVWLGGDPAARLLLSLTTMHVGEADVVAAIMERLHGSGLPPHLR